MPTDESVRSAAASPPQAPSLPGRAIWITWERQRRSLELAAALGAPIHVLLSRRRYLLRVAILSARTVVLLLAARPRFLFVQNPSMALATLACALRWILGYRLIVDRHSNFRLHERHNPSLKWKVFHGLSRYTVRAADLTIVTNETLRALVDDWGGRGFVLPDRVPTLRLAGRKPLPGQSSVVFICSHQPDEPVREVLEAAATLPDVDVYVTGDASRTARRWASLLGPNVRLTGFLPEADYQSMLASCDAVLALTTAPNTLLCGAYEAVAVGKPLVLSNQADLADYFSKGRVLTDNSVESLVLAIRTALAEAPRLTVEMQDLKRELAESWNHRWRRLLALVGGLG